MKNKIEIAKCPLLSWLKSNAVDMKPVYIDITNYDKESLCVSVLGHESKYMLLIPSEWTLNEGVKYLKEDAQVWLKSEE